MNSKLSVVYTAVCAQSIAEKETHCVSSSEWVRELPFWIHWACLPRQFPAFYQQFWTECAPKRANSECFSSHLSWFPTKSKEPLFFQEVLREHTWPLRWPARILQATHAWFKKQRGSILKVCFLAVSFVGTCQLIAWCLRVAFFYGTFRPWVLDSSFLDFYSFSCILHQISVFLALVSVYLCKEP